MSTDELKDYMDMRFTELRDHFDQKARDIETNLLREFRKWAVRIESSAKVQRTRSDGMEQRLEMVEERLDRMDERQDGK